MTDDPEQSPAPQPQHHSDTIDAFSMAIIEARLPPVVRAQVYDALIRGESVNAIPTVDDEIRETLELLGNRPLCASIDTWLQTGETTIAALFEQDLRLVLRGVEPHTVIAKLREKFAVSGLESGSILIEEATDEPESSWRPVPPTTP